MASPNHRSNDRRGTGLCRRSGSALRFLTAVGSLVIAVGLETGGSGLARAQSVEAALACLRDQRALEALRDRRLTAADSLATLVEESGAPSTALLREAERLEQESLDREVDLLVQREACREAASSALPVLESRLGALTDRIAANRATIAEAEEWRALQQARADLQAALAEPVSLGYPDLPPEPGDSQETLRGKLQYHAEIAAYLRSVEARVAQRIAQLEGEAQVLAQANRFLQDLAFVDEGGRLEAGGTMRLRGAGPEGEGDLGDAGRPFAGMPADGRDATLDFALRYSPLTPAESRRVREVLGSFRQEIQKELQKIGEQIESIEPRLSPELPAPR